MLAYSIACFVLFITPGPDMSLFLSRTIAGGRWAGIASVTGSTIGCAVHSILAALGISALIAASPSAFLILKIVGAVYLLWLAIDAVRNGSSLNVRPDAHVRTSHWRTLIRGILVNLSNPKIVLFYITFLPQFVQAGHPHAWAQVFFLGVFFLVATYPLAILMILGAERVVTTLKARPAVMRAIDWLFAGIFGAFAVKILTTQAR
jgi:threonine/homoserine/homoserine lactone efflux protein